jgi:hypothetical protein
MAGGCNKGLEVALIGEKLRFEVNLRPAEPARLKISARMLSVAYRVISA